ncbi:hypothetical protein HLH34_07970 [Gluconacetobacter azotocaptans]|uniref:Uncharacterized protein n=1 Tax=Gluconacetobacter azotocaptans TaxID=142834 RepID=A0A7W4JS50_9PROT|nr:hypothetical protein [Gluconacetobacter azotocaptans]MBB2189903.1 hypothetical protein [Gluconacetobacter azotocaptans]
MSLPLLLPAALCWPFLSMAVLAACPQASARSAAVGLSAIGLGLAVLAACAGGGWAGTPFMTPPGVLCVLLPLPLLTLCLSCVLSPAGAVGQRGGGALTHGLAGGATVATACADPLSGAVAIGGVAVLAALAIATTRGAARTGWDLFRLDLSGILLAVPGAMLPIAAPEGAGRLDGLGGVLLSVGLGTVAGLGPAAPVVLAAGDYAMPAALAPVMASVPVLRHLGGQAQWDTMMLGIATIWLVVLPMRAASASRRERLALGMLVGLAAVAAGAGGRAGQVGAVALLVSVALLGPLAGTSASGGMAARWLRAALALRPPFLPFGGLVLTVLAVCDAAPLLVGPLLLGLVPGCARTGFVADGPGDVASAARDRPAWLAVALLLAGMVVLTVVAVTGGAGR